MAEALEAVKRSFGREAVILSTRTLAKGGFLGVGGNPSVEITAVRDMSDLPAQLRRGTVQLRPGHSKRADGAAAAVSPTTQARSNRSTDALTAEVGGLKSLIRDLVDECRRAQAPSVPEALFDTYRQLMQNEVADELAQQLVRRVAADLGADQLRDAGAVRAWLATAMESMLPTAGPIQLTPGSPPAIIAFIGPTGVGKTTTIAKLAAHFRLREHRKVGLVTIDTYRIAAIEQLRTYAQIIDVPLEVAASPAQLEGAISRLDDHDLILIDTAGRSQRDHQKMKDLHAFLDAIHPDEIHLVLSMGSGKRVLTETIERFSAFAVNRVVFTKLDEAIGFGVILTCLQRVNAGLSYVTTGQDVPDDIAVGDGRLIAELIIEGDAKRLGRSPRHVGERREAGPPAGSRSTGMRGRGPAHRVAKE